MKRASAGAWTRDTRREIAASVDIGALRGGVAVLVFSCRCRRWRVRWTVDFAPLGIPLKISRADFLKFCCAAALAPAAFGVPSAGTAADDRKPSGNREPDIRDAFSCEFYQ